MKKFLAIAIAALMMLTFSMGVYATTPGDVPVNVTVEVIEASPETNVTVDWTSFNFTYVFTKTWNPSTLQDDVDGGWVNDDVDSDVEAATKSATIRVSNNSNHDVTVGITYAAATNVTGVTVDFAEVTGEDLDSAVGLSVADYVEATLTVSGTPATVADASKVQVGTISVSVA